MLRKASTCVRRARSVCTEKRAHLGGQKGNAGTSSIARCEPLRIEANTIVELQTELFAESNTKSKIKIKMAERIKTVAAVCPPCLMLERLEHCAS
mmetsp:Transcript_7103/g.11930  ORF Transcript_7103/g.11930 Transcript_7103/m.11930 type:complete len:95 (-) Transcript_7103:343-627(-)